MLGRLRSALILLILATSLAAAVPTAASPTSSDVGRYIVVLKSSAGDPAAAANSHAVKYGVQPDLIFRYAILGYSAAVPEARLAQLKADPSVAYVTADVPIQLDAKPGGTPPQPPQTIPTGVDRIDGPTQTSLGRPDGTNADVAVIDTGVASHPDLNLVGGTSCQKGNTSDYFDVYGHGTHVAGTIAARNNSIGVVGAAPGARIWSVRIFNKYAQGTISNAVCGLDWVAGQTNADGTAKIEAVNMSFGWAGSDDQNCGNTNNDVLHQAICRTAAKGIVLVASAGNDSKDAATKVPAAYDEVITVSALADSDGAPGGAWPTGACRVDQEDTLADFSNFGSDVDIIAPGVCINSTSWTGGYALMSGTSMATPHVVGAAALYRSLHPTATNADVKTALTSSGTYDWDATSDHDSVQEPLLNIATF